MGVTCFAEIIDGSGWSESWPGGDYHIGRTIVLRGNVSRIIGCKGSLNVIDPLHGAAKPLFRFDDSAGGDAAPPVVELEGLHTDFSSGPFVVRDSQASITFCEACFTDKPFQTILAETRGGQTKTLSRTDPAWRQHLTLYTSAGP